MKAVATRQADRNEIRRALASLSFRDWVFLGSTVVGLFSFVFGIVLFLLVQVGRIDRLELLMADTRASLSRIEESLDRLRADFEGLTQAVGELKTDVEELKTEVAELRTDLQRADELLNADLAWRYLYSNNPAWKNYAPRYDPVRRKLDFVPIAPGQTN